MTPSELTTRVTLDTCVAGGGLAALGWWLPGGPIGLGGLAGRAPPGGEVLWLVASRNLQLVPRGLQNFLEVVLEQFQQMIDDVMGHEGRRYLPLIATLGLFILTSNLMGLVPGLTGVTSNLNTNAACALVVFIAYHWIGARKQGLIPYLKHLAGP